MPRHFVSLADHSTEQLRDLLDLARHIKLNPSAFDQACRGRTLAMIFQKPSLRTRVSFQTGIYQLGGQGIYLGPKDIQLHRGETIADTAQVLSRYVDGIMARVFAHSDILDLADQRLTVPVINGLSDLNHPCQVLADLLTIEEKKGSDQGPARSPTWATATTWPTPSSTAAPCMGMSTSPSATPAATPPTRRWSPAARELRRRAPGPACSSPRILPRAVDGADAVYTDVWASMGQEEEHAERLKRFEGFEVDNAA